MSPYLDESGEGIPDQAIERLMYGIDRYRFARDQDKNFLVAATHNSYALALAEALMDMVSAEDIRRVTGRDIAEVRKEILSVQEEHEQKMFRIFEELKRRGIDAMKIVEGM